MMRHSTPFVLLEHRTHAEVHWDLMIATLDGATLATWRLDQNPIAPCGDVITAERITDHRVAYLEFEGELSGGRGAVRRVERGEALDVRIDGANLSGVLRGAALQARVEIRGGRWTWQ